MKTGGATPVPLRETVWVLSASVMVSVPVAEPNCAGRKTTLMVHTAPAANCVLQLGVSSNGPLTEMLMPVSGMPPMLVIVTGCAAEVWPWGVEAKASELGLTMPVGGARAVPVSSTICVPAPSVSVSKPAKLPVVVGANST